jgi:hypothetical protein
MLADHPAEQPEHVEDNLAQSENGEAGLDVLEHTASIEPKSTWSTADEQVLQGARAFLAPHLKIAKALVGSDNLRDQITTLVALQLATLDQSAFVAQWVAEIEAAGQREREQEFQAQEPTQVPA